MKIDRHRFTQRPHNPMGKLFAVISAVWLAVWLIGWLIINWSPA